MEMRRSVMDRPKLINQTERAVQLFGEATDVPMLALNGVTRIDGWIFRVVAIRVSSVPAPE